MRAHTTTDVDGYRHTLCATPAADAVGGIAFICGSRGKLDEIGDGRMRRHPVDDP